MWGKQENLHEACILVEEQIVSDTIIHHVMINAKDPNKG